MITLSLKGSYSFNCILTIRRDQLLCTMKKIIIFNLKLSLSDYHNIITRLGMNRIRPRESCKYYI